MNIEEYIHETITPKLLNGLRVIHYNPLYSQRGNGSHGEVILCREDAIASGELPPEISNFSFYDGKTLRVSLNECASKQSRMRYVLTSLFEFGELPEGYSSEKLADEILSNPKRYLGILDVMDNALEINELNNISRREDSKQANK